MHCSLVNSVCCSLPPGLGISYSTTFCDCSHSLAVNKCCWLRGSSLPYRTLSPEIETLGTRILLIEVKFPLHSLLVFTAGSGSLLVWCPQISQLFALWLAKLWPSITSMADKISLAILCTVRTVLHYLHETRLIDYAIHHAIPMCGRHYCVCPIYSARPIFAVLRLVEGAMIVDNSCSSSSHGLAGHKRLSEVDYQHRL